MITNRDLCFFPLGSIGDCFVASGAANWFADRCNCLFFPVLHDPSKPSLFETVTTLFKDNKKIQVFEYFDPEYSDLNEILFSKYLTPLGVPNYFTALINDTVCTPLWDEQIYTSLDLPFSIRYSHFRMPNVDCESKELFNSVVKNKRYILVSQKIRNSLTQVLINLDDARKTLDLDPLDQLQIIELSEDLSNNIVLYAELIKHAEEIHCAPSSVFCFVDSIVQTTNAKLFYHDIRKETVMRINNNWNNHRWKIINYACKL